MENRNLINEMVDNGPELLKPGKSILDWFSPTNTDHLTAYKVLQESGQWPRGFIPEGLEFPENWNASLAQRVARHFMGASDTKAAATVASEGIEPAETDSEDIKIKKLTEQVSEEDFKKIPLLGKKNEAEDELEEEPEEEVEESKINELDKDIPDEPKVDNEVPPESPEEKPEDEESPEPEEEEPEEVELEKAYLGRSADKHLYIIANKGDTGAVEDLLIVDQEGETVMSAKEEGLEATDIPGFIEHAIQDTAKVKLEYVERGIVLKYVLPKAEEELGIEEPEEEEEVEDEFGAEEEMPPEVPEEEPKKPKEEKPKESKTNEARMGGVEKEYPPYLTPKEEPKDETSRKEHLLKKKAGLEKDIADIQKKVKEVESDLKRLGSTNEARMGVDYVRTMKAAVKTAVTALKDKDYEAASKALEDVADDASDAAKAAKKMKREVDSKAETEKTAAEGAKESKTDEGKIPSDTEPEDAQIKKLTEIKVSDDENTFDVDLVDDGTMDTVISINDREFRFDAEFASNWRNEETGELSGEGLKELALDALSSLEEDEYKELVGKTEECTKEGEEPEMTPEKCENCEAKAGLSTEAMTELKNFMFQKEKREHPGFDDEQIQQIVKDHMKEMGIEECEECAAKECEEAAEVDEKKKPPVCPKCKKAHWPFQKCSAKGPVVKAKYPSTELGKGTKESKEIKEGEIGRNLCGDSDFVAKWQKMINLLSPGEREKRIGTKNKVDSDSAVKLIANMSNASMRTEMERQNTLWGHDVRPDDDEEEHGEEEDGDGEEEGPSAASRHGSHDPESYWPDVSATLDIELREDPNFLKTLASSHDFEKVLDNLEAWRDSDVFVDDEKAAEVEELGLDWDEYMREEIPREVLAKMLKKWLRGKKKGSKAVEGIEPAETDSEDIKIKKLTEQGEGELKDVYEVLYTTKEGEAKSTRIMAFNVDDAKKQLLRNASVKSVSSVNKIGEKIGDNKMSTVKHAVKAKHSSIELGKGTKESIEESQEIDPAVLKAQELLGILPESKVVEQPIKEGDTIQIVRADTFECLVEEAIVKFVDEKKGIEITGETIPENQRWFDKTKHIFVLLQENEMEKSNFDVLLEGIQKDTSVDEGIDYGPSAKKAMELKLQGLSWEEVESKMMADNKKENTIETRYPSLGISYAKKNLQARARKAEN